MASIVQIAINARNQAAAAFGAAQRQLGNLNQATQRVTRSMFAQQRQVSSVAGAYRDANGLWRTANGRLLTQRHTVTTVTTAYGRLVNAIQNATSALIRYTMVARIANALGDVDRMRGFAMAFGLLATKAGLAAAVILPLIGTIGNLIPLVMLIAPAAATAGLAVVGLKLAFNGMSDALQAGLSGDTEAFTKALKKLAPQAADTVKALVKIRDQWRDTAKGFQGRVFEGAASELLALSNFIKPVADRWLPRLALRFAEVRSEMADGLASFAADGRLEAVWRNIHVALSDLLDTVKPLGRAFGDILEVAAPRFAEVAGHIKGAAQAFSDWIRRSKESGKLGEWLDKAMTTFGKLKEIIVNLSTAFAGIFKASSGGGDSMLDSFVAWTKDLSDWVNSGDGQKMIGIFSSLFSALSNSAPIFSAILDYISAMGALWSGMAAAGRAAWEGLVIVVKAVIMLILDQLGMLVNGAAKAFGWIPGIGDKLKGAAQAFNAFRDQVNNSLNGIQKTVDITVNYRAVRIGPHMVSGAQQSGTYSSGIGGRAAGGPGGAPKQTGEWGHEIVDFTRGMVYNSNQTKRMMAAMSGGGGGGGGTVVNVAVERGRLVGDPLADAVIGLFSSGRLKLVDVGNRPVRVA